jgi:hypothetical protein
MERIAAIKKLRKMLGKEFAYRVDPQASSPEERREAQAKIKAAAAKRDALGEAMTKRRDEIIAADSEYQQLLKQYGDARKEYDALNSIAHCYKFTVGTANRLFFRVAANGDSWEDVIAKINGERK